MIKKIREQLCKPRIQNEKRVFGVEPSGLTVVAGVPHNTVPPDVDLWVPFDQRFRRIVVNIRFFYSKIQVSVDNTGYHRMSPLSEIQLLFNLYEIGVNGV